DVAHAATRAVEGAAAPGIYELGGPDVNTFRELIVQMLGVIHRRRLILGLPIWVGRIMGTVFDGLNALSFGLIKGPVTRDQVKNLARDNVASGDYPGLAELGIQPTALEAVLPEYLWRFRPQGQYAEITESAKNLRS
ncbi:MAG: complex I NDUFA9 subunit family protein, partial [Pseudomonadota bacterium]